METITFLQGFATPALDTFFQLVTRIGNTNAYIVLLLTVYLAVDSRFGQRLGILVLVSYYLNFHLKGLLETARPFELNPALGRTPEGANCSESGPGFPSAHAQISLTFWGYLAWWLRRPWFWGLALLIITALVSLSRMYLGLHFPVDVLGGLIIGLLGTTVMAVAEPLWLEVRHISRGVRLTLGFLIPLFLMLLLPPPGQEPDLISRSAGGLLHRAASRPLHAAPCVLGAAGGSVCRDRLGFRCAQRLEPPLTRGYKTQSIWRLYALLAAQLRRPARDAVAGAAGEARARSDPCGGLRSRSSMTVQTFFGWQVQAKTGERTVQGVVEAALADVPGAAPRIMAAGRTDAGVHALAMTAHYLTEDTVPIAKVPAALNARLPADVRVLHAEAVGSRVRGAVRLPLPPLRISDAPTFRDGLAGSALDRQRVLFLTQRLDTAAMHAAAPHFEGTHDFAALATQETRPTVRTVFLCRLVVSGPALTLHVAADGFLRNMVRALVGTLLWVGEGKLTPADIPALLAAKEPPQNGAERSRRTASTLPKRGTNLGPDSTRTALTGDELKGQLEHSDSLNITVPPRPG